MDEPTRDWRVSCPRCRYRLTVQAPPTGVLCNSIHITASVFVNDDEAGLRHDFGVWLEKLTPFNPDPNHYHQNLTGEDNTDAPLKRQVMGPEVVVAITKGKLDFGPWE